MIGEIEAGIVSIHEAIVRPRSPEGLAPAVVAVEGVRRDGRGQTGLVFACREADVAMWEELDLRGQRLELSMRAVTDLLDFRAS